MPSAMASQIGGKPYKNKRSPDGHPRKAATFCLMHDPYYGPAREMGLRRSHPEGGGIVAGREPR